MAYLGRVKPTETTSSVLRSTYTGNGSTTTYALPGPVANETSIIATINGVTQQDAAYSTDGSNIIFDTAPASGDSIEIRTISAVAVSYAPMAGSVVTGTIADLAVTTGKIADNSITTAKIAAGAVVQADLATGVAGNGPAFRAWQSVQQTGISSGVFTKVTLTTEEFDTADCYANSRFTPNVAGYYQINATLWILNSGSTNLNSGFANLWKNGSWYADGTFHTTGGSYQVNEIGNTISTLMYLNGTTDYVELYSWGSTSSGTYVTIGSNQQQRIHFSGSLVRAA
jgi:hypothetical protein